MLARLNEYRQVAAGAAAVLAAYIYGVADLAVSAFFGYFGISPSEAGLSQSTLVARALSGLAFLFGVFAVAGLAGAVAYHWIRSAAEANSRRPEAVLAIAVPVAAAGYWMIKTGPGLPGLTLCLSGLSVACASALGVHAPSAARRQRGWVLVGAVLAASLAWLFLMEVSLGSERLAHKLMRDGDFRDASMWEGAVHLMLGINPVPVEAGEEPCSVLLAWSGDDAWVMASPDEGVQIRRIDRNDITIRYSVRDGSAEPRRRTCW